MDQALDLQHIENELDSQLSGRWSLVPLTTKSRNGLPLSSFTAVWRIELIDGDMSYPGINFLYVGIDKHFPRTQPLIWLPQYVHGKSKYWPHVNDLGGLCLPRSSMKEAHEKRIIQHLAWAHELLNMDPITRRKDFAREAVAYWAQSHDNLEDVYSLLSHKTVSRLIAYSADAYRKIFVADTAEELAKYLMHLRSDTNSTTILQGYLVWLESPWCPDEFPEFSNSLLNLIPVDIQDRILVPGRDCLIVIGSNSENGVIFFSALLKSKKLSDVRRGFRPRSKLPASIIRSAFLGARIHKMDVSRVDGAWVHGRDHDQNYEKLSNKKVVICGCGSLGASVARLLAQAGIGTLHLVDGDKVASYNASRHLLGVGDTGAKKVEVLRTLLLADFPHMRDVTAHYKKIEMLNTQELELIQQADIIVSAGITVSGDLFLDEWRRANGTSLVHVCAWVEAFAIAGHAVALFGVDTIADMFDENMEISFRLCDVPADANHLVTMAGCGDTFQPHGAVELQSTVNITARLVIEILTNQVAKSVRRTWFGSLNETRQRNLIPRAAFDNEFCIRDFSWP